VLCDKSVSVYSGNQGIDNALYFYDRYDYPTIDTTDLEIDQVADCIAEIVEIRGGYGKCQS